MKTTTLNTIRQLIRDNEGQPPYPYLDIKGNVTIGTGFHIQNEKRFRGLAVDQQEDPKAGVRGREKSTVRKHARLAGKSEQRA